LDLPSTIYVLNFLDMPAKRNILGGNAQRLFNLDPVYSPVKLARRTSAAQAREKRSERVAGA
jgi:hypothetical protein